ncbi:single-stranded DNA-binding protein [Alloscardovia venturai]|uniref:Single-stranded DNA-binding protein n=1 Tax=Alloscardovia venturai TaxID=1769421 RepID=A0ABW2Y6N2_9BIFI
MAHITHTVLTGYVGNAPKQWNSAGNSTACSFRVGSTRRYFSVKDNEWKSAETTWIQVKAFRRLADNVLKSLKVGDPVIIVGNLTIDQWEKDGIQHSAPVIEATSIGHDLGLGTDVFAKDEPINKTTDTLVETPPTEPSSVAEKSLPEAVMA